MAAFKKVCKVHERLPDGGILVFLSGQLEVEQLIKFLKIKYKQPEKIEVKTKSRKRLKYLKKGVGFSIESLIILERKKNQN